MKYQPNKNIPAPEQAKTSVFEHGGRKVMVMGSVAYATPAERGHVIVTGSHGGRSAGEYAARIAPLAAVANDAGVGKNSAGVAGMKALDAQGIAGLTVSHTTARIGEGPDAWYEGEISFVNDTAMRAGLRKGVALRVALEAFLRGLPPVNALSTEPQPEVPWEGASMMRKVLIEKGGLRVVAMDSMSLVEPEDRGQVVIAAGNGGLESGALAQRFACALVAFNDAGIGKQRAGIAGLIALDVPGIPGIGVSHLTAQISDGLDTWDNGVVSFANQRALASGIQVGERVKDAVMRFIDSRMISKA